MKALNEKSLKQFKAVLAAINYYRAFEFVTIKQLVVFSYFCTCGASKYTDALKGLDNVFTQEEFKDIIKHLTNIELLHQINKRGKFPIYSPTRKGTKLHKAIIFL